MTSKLANYIEEVGVDAFKKQCYGFASKANYACILDSCQLQPEGKYDFLFALNAKKVINHSQSLFTAINAQQWLFGVQSYDLKNEIENLTSNNPSALNCPDLLFFVPSILVAISHDGRVEELEGCLPDAFYTFMSNGKHSQITQESKPLVKEDYIASIHKIHRLIEEGEVYELNFCTQHRYSFAEFDTGLFQIELLKESPVPMGSYFKSETYALCGASMERFIQKSGRSIISQPIKGTIARGSQYDEDEANKKHLHSSIKDRAENVMIVDLVRNDLNRICKTGSVSVTDLFGIYTFPKVHQMISTIEGELQDAIDYEQIQSALFPMGSMTGAPKIAAMKHIEELESFKREWYSGSVGYIDPDGNFDFNVVIRSVVVNLETKALTYCSGGAITIDSNPEDEWKEMQLKTSAIRAVLLNDRIEQ